MKLVGWRVLIDNGFSASREFQVVERDVRGAIQDVVWPTGCDQFVINPVRRGNGVVPIKELFRHALSMRGWIPERDRFDLYLPFPGDRELPFAVEWETGNISSSHRAINRILLAMLQGRISGGILVLPSRSLYQFLTDRVGNVAELEPYFPLWERLGAVSGVGYLAVVAVEHDVEDSAAPLLRKGTDGRALR